ncbi:MAG TPA: DUF3775 domain-containing protein [Candidatus Binatia bacterium]|nr:DUF3775 domain-containing protein [Candidatus Binatia bacterium]
MAFRDIVARVMEVAPDQRLPDSEVRKSKPGLQAYLETLSESELAKLQTLMYLGRDRDPSGDIQALHRDLVKVTHGREDLVRTLVEKVPLRDYLAEGLKVARDTGYDIEQPF